MVNAVYIQEVKFASSLSQFSDREVSDGLTKKSCVYLVWFVSGLVSSFEVGSGRSRPCSDFWVVKPGGVAGKRQVGPQRGLGSLK